MVFKALEFLERVEMRILIVEANDESNRNLVVCIVIQEGSAVSICLQRPTDGV